MTEELLDRPDQVDEVTNAPSGDGPEAGADAPTHEAYDDLERAYQHLNRELFGGELPGALFTFQRNKRFLGFFSRKRFQHAKTKAMTDEIAMNPGYFAIRPIEAVLSTLAHEMCHQWQALKGNGGRRGYHNREFADKMKEIGLQTSSTGKPGGKEVGESMTHFILPDGAFLASVKRLLATDFGLSWLDRYPEHAEYPAYIPTEEELRELYPDEYGDEDASKGGSAMPPPLLAPVLGSDGITPIEVEAASDKDAHVDAQAGGTDGLAGPASEQMDADDGLPRIVVPPKGAAPPVLSKPPSASGLDIEFPKPARAGGKSKTTRVKFVCPACGDAAWGKPGLHLICGKCKTRMPPFGDGEDNADA